jgi:phospholipid transport system substrate-binding protein
MKKLIAVLAGLLAVSGVWADEIVAPDVMVRNVTDDVLAIVRQDKDIQKGDSAKTVRLVETKVLPHFDFERMTALAMGKDWRRASPEQKSTLIEEFRTLLVRTYSKALTEYRNQTMTINLLRAQPDGSDARVRAKVHQPGGKSILIDYDLEKSDNAWKVYDISVDGISLVTNYRGSFGQEVSANGVDGLIKSLHSKNQGNADQASSRQ